jgi:hypothetical protein
MSGYKHDRDRRENLPLNQTSLNHKQWSLDDMKVPIEGSQLDTPITIDTFEDRYSEVLRPYFTEPLESAEKPTPELQCHFEEVWGEEARLGQVRLVFCNWYHRWVVIQKTKTGEWAYALICSDGSKMTGRGDEKLPADLEALNYDGRFDGLRGNIGDFKIPTREDLFNMKKAADLWEQQGKLGQAQWDREEAKKKAMRDKIADWEYDAHGHTFEAWRREYHRSRGGMQGLAFVPGTSLEQLAKEMEPLLYEIEDRGGYKIKRRRKDTDTTRLLAIEQLDKMAAHYVELAKYTKLSDLDKQLHEQKVAELKARIEALKPKPKNEEREEARAMSSALIELQETKERRRQAELVPAHE